MENAPPQEEMETRSTTDLSTVTANETVIPNLLDESKKSGENKDAESQQVTGTEAKKVQIKRIFAFIGLQLALFLAALDSTIVSTAIPRIGSDFNQMAIVSWVATAYLLTFDAFQPLFSKFSDIFGRKWIMLFGITVFLIGSVLCGAAQSMIMLIVSRAIAGIGGAGIFSMVFVIISDLVPLEKRGSYQGIINAVFALASVCGPLIGGSLTDYVTWRWSFYINLPIGGAAMAALVLFLELPTPKEKFAEKLKRIDYAGTVIVLTFATLFLLAMNFGGQTFPWKSAAVIVPLVLTVLLVGLLMFVESKFAREPLMPPRLFKVRNVTSILVSYWFLGMALFSLAYYLPIYFQVVRADSAMWSGIRLIPLQMTISVMSTAVGFFITKTGIFRPMIQGGMALLTMCVGLVSMLDLDTSWPNIYGFTIIGGLGLGMCFASAITGLQASAEPRDAAVVTGLANFSYALGSALGVAISSAILNSSLQQDLPGVIPDEYVQRVISNSEFVHDGLPPEWLDLTLEAYVAALRLVWYVMIAMAGAGFIATLFIKNETLLKAAKKAAAMPNESKKENIEAQPDEIMKDDEAVIVEQNNADAEISEKKDMIPESDKTTVTAEVQRQNQRKNKNDNMVISFAKDGPSTS